MEKTYIAQNGNNNNVIGFNVVRIEEDLADTKASQYTREQVLNQGTTVINALPRVVVGDATITNIPGGFTIKSGEKLGPLTNEQLINILNTGTGIALSSEMIEGSLEQGIRVTYAVQFFVKVGNKSVQDFALCA